MSDLIDSRSKFIGTVATGLATTLASPKGVLRQRPSAHGDHRSGSAVIGLYGVISYAITQRTTRSASA